eukprot:15480400-Alexandrium_andersonii.AAC.1
MAPAAVSRAEGPARARLVQAELESEEPSRPGKRARRAGREASAVRGADVVQETRRSNRGMSAGSSGGRGLLSLPRVGSETDFVYKKQWSCDLCRFCIVCEDSKGREL